MSQVEYVGTKDYIVSEELRHTIKVAVALGRPLLVKGEPGTGKTVLARSLAEALGMRLLVWNIKSTSKAQEGLYVYDAVQRLYDSQFGDDDVSDIKRYVKLGPLGEAFSSPERLVILIDEIDKADLEFPNDLLWELDMMSFYIPETRETVKANHRPVVVITSNSEKELPDAFLRRCVFHYIAFPDQAMMREIINVHYPNLELKLVDEAIRAFYWVRDLPGLMKRPSTSELLDWCQALVLGGVVPERITRELPFLGVLLKKDKDMDLAQRALSRTAGGQGWGF